MFNLFEYILYMVEIATLRRLKSKPNHMCTGFFLLMPTMRKLLWKIPWEFRRCTVKIGKKSSNSSYYGVAQTNQMFHISGYRSRFRRVWRIANFVAQNAQQKHLCFHFCEFTIINCCEDEARVCVNWKLLFCKIVTICDTLTFMCILLHTIHFLEHRCMHGICFLIYCFELSF